MRKATLLAISSRIRTFSDVILFFHFNALRLCSISSLDPHRYGGGFGIQKTRLEKSSQSAFFCSILLVH